MRNAGLVVLFVPRTPLISRCHVQGDRLGAAEVGLLATVGAVTANVFPKPEVSGSRDSEGGTT
eukprot:216641-Rhodomonas_salina.1